VNKEAMTHWGAFAPKTNKLNGTCIQFFAGVNKLKVSTSYCVAPTSNAIRTLYLGITVN
jgi:hypothetical protein